jgi:hypothetical protein
MLKNIYKGPATYAPGYSLRTVQQTDPNAPANGSCGTVKRFDVPDKTAAMLMAIVADTIKTPLNQLRFISIREITQ